MKYKALKDLYLRESKQKCFTKGEIYDFELVGGKGFEDSYTTIDDQNDEHLANNNYLKNFELV